MRTLQGLIENWDGLAVVNRFDGASGAWIFICLHDNTLGPSTGGTRIAQYPTPADGLLDAMRLSEGMTQKWAAVDLGFGGGKAVIAIPRPFAGREREELLLRYAELINLLKGSFLTGEDMGTTRDDMEFLARQTDYVHGVDANGAKVDPSPFTARGVLTGLETSLARVFGDSSPKGRKILIQGTGNVGSHLGRLLAAKGAQVLIHDIDPERARNFADEIEGRVINGEDIYSVDCDVFAPCAIGGVLDRETIPRLRCQIIAGSANNQLADAEDAGRLKERGILYAPDFIVNAGGAISFAHIGRGVSDSDALLEKVDSIGPTLGEVLDRADSEDITTLEAAARLVDRNLKRGSVGR